MPRLRIVLCRLFDVLRRETLEGEMSAEMHAHVALQAELNVRVGMTARAAPHAALRQFGNMTLIQERVRDQRSFGWLERSWSDLRFAGRSLRRAPAFSLAGPFTLAICIGSTRWWHRERSDAQ